MSQVESARSWLALTLPQLDFWEEFALHPDQPVSTVAHCLEIEGDVDERALVRAIAQTVQESEVLSLRFREGAEGELPTQRLELSQVPVVQQRDLRAAADPRAEAKRLMDEDLNAPCDLRRDKLSAQALYRVGEGQYLWYIRAHHIIVDGYGLSLIERRAAQLYGHFCGRGEAGPAFHPFTVFLGEEQAYRAGPRWEADRAYWTQYLARAAELPVLDKGIEDYGAAGLHHHLELPDALGHKLRALTSALDIGWPDLLVLLSGAYIHHAKAHRPDADDVLTLWLPFMSRWGSVGAYVPAMLVNILPFHLTVQPDETLGAFLRRSASALRKQRAHGRYRIEQIAADRKLEKRRRFFFSPLINVLPFTAPVFDGCRVTRDVLASGVGDGLNLTFRAEDDASHMSLHLEADGSIDAAMFEHLRQELPGFLDQALSVDVLDRPLASFWANLTAAREC